MVHSGVPIGAVLAGRYQITRVLGQGGMGVVVQAMHLQLHQPVAMKFLLPEVLGNQQIVQRFLREAQAAVRLRSEHVARVIDVGSLENGAPYMVLEYLEGSDLSNFPRGQLTIGGIVDLILQACEALAEAHSLGIVHRDIKPANFFITRGPDGAPLLKVLDFGISKTRMTDNNLTGTQAVMGTPAYMSPEQMRSSRDVDHRSDIWSLGVVLYELLQGAQPFGSDTFSSMVIRVVTEALPRLTVQLPGELDQIVYRCLDKDPARRFQNVAELAQALAPYAQTETQASISVQRTRSIIGVAHHPMPDPGPARRALPPSTLSGSAVANTTSQGKRRWPMIAGLGAVAGIAAIAVAASLGGGKAGTGSGSGKAELVPAVQPAQPPTTPQVTPPPPPAVVTTPPTTPPADPAVHQTDPSGVTPTDPANPANPANSANTASAQTPADPASIGNANVGADTATQANAQKKPKKPGKPSSSQPKPPKPTTTPDDDILGTRN